MTTTAIHRPDVRVPPAARKVLLTAHVVTAVALVGVDLVLLVLGAAGLRDTSPATVYPAMHLMAQVVLAPLALVALAIGVAQAALTGYGLLRYWWVTTKLAITSALAAVAVLVVVPGLGRAATAATDPAGEVADAQRVVAFVTPSIALVLLVLMAALGVFKPGRRRRGSGR